MEVLFPFFLCALILAGFWCLWRICLFFNRRSAKKSILDSGLFTPRTVHALLLSEFGERRVLSGRSLPKDTEGYGGLVQIDHLLFLRGAVVILQMERNGEYRARASAKLMVAGVLREGEFPRVPVEELTVKLPARKKKERTDESTNLMEVMRTLLSLQKKRRFTHKESMAMKKCLRAASLSHAEAQTKNKQSRQGRT